MKTIMLDNFPAGDNIFIHDPHHMGTRVAKNVVILHTTHNSEEAKYIIVANEKTGKRMKVILG